MATTKKVEETTQKVEETTPNETIKVRLPRLNGVNANQDEFFSVNFKNYIIKRGEYVEIPKELYEVIVNGEKAEEAAFKFAEEQAVKEA